MSWKFRWICSRRYPRRWHAVHGASTRRIRAIRAIRCDVRRVSSIRRCESRCEIRCEIRCAIRRCVRRSGDHPNAVHNGGTDHVGDGRRACCVPCAVSDAEVLVPGIHP